MKKIFMRYHDLLDKLSVTVFLYSVIVLILILFSAWITIEEIRAILCLICPLFMLKTNIITKVNKFFHDIFNFPL